VAGILQGNIAPSGIGVLSMGRSWLERLRLKTSSEMFARRIGNSWIKVSGRKAMISQWMKNLLNQVQAIDPKINL
jgi:hypothetical protein